MEFSEKLFIKFLNSLIAFDKNSRSVLDLVSRVTKDRDDGEKSEWAKVCSEAEQKAKGYVSKTDSIISNYQRQADNILSHDLKDKAGVFARLQKCKEQLALVTSAEKSITDKATYTSANGGSAHTFPITIDEILQGKIDFIAKALEVNDAVNSSKKRSSVDVCSAFYTMCRTAGDLLNQEITLLRGMIIQNRDALQASHSDVGSGSHDKMVAAWTTINKGLTETSSVFARQRDSSLYETKRTYSSLGVNSREKLNSYWR